MTNQSNQKSGLAPRADGFKAGYDDYIGRAEEVRRGAEELDWAWPYSGADDAYINAVGTGAICRRLRISESKWEDICDEWLEGFEAGYRKARADHEGEVPA